MNERIIEDVVREDLKSKGYIFEEQISSNPILKNLIKSKTGGKGFGRPEFIVDNLWNSTSILLIECKSNKSKHESKDRNCPKDYAVDGVLHYAKELTNAGIEVIAIAVSGDAKDNCISTFHCKNNDITEYNNECDILTASGYNKLVYPVSKISIDNVISTAKSIHNYIRDYIKLTEDEKPKIVAGCLIALDDPQFRAGYPKAMPGGTLCKHLYNTVKTQLENSEMPIDKAGATLSEFAFILHHQELNVGHNLRNFILQLEKDIFPYVKEDHDVVGMFYGEFLKYVGGDGKGLGIVLTPKHITELFCDLAQLTEKSIVLDTCCGTGGFLIAAMIYMLNKSTTEEQRVNIKKNQLIGVEQAAKMYFLATSNMYLRGDGKANLYLGSCFDKEISKDIKENKRPNVALLNPPYSQKGDGLSELHFIKHTLDLLQPNGICIAIVPMSCGIKPTQIRKDLLKEHTLEACFSMPDDLFYPVGVVTCILIFKAQVPHSIDTKTWFGYLKDDGFIKTRTQGRADTNNRWQSIKQQFLIAYKNKETAPGLFVSAVVDADSEWCAEAYLETDYNKLNSLLFDKSVLDFEAFKIKTKKLEVKKTLLTSKEWKEFKISDLFDLMNGKGSPQAEDGGTIPIITSTIENNGVSGYLLASNNIIKAPAITISIRGGGNAFFQSSDFVASLNALVLKPKFKINESIGLFLCVILNMDCYKYSYGRIRTLGRVNQETIKLPTTQEGDPNWQWMENYMKNNFGQQAVILN